METVDILTNEVEYRADLMRRLDAIETKIDECLAVHKYVMEQVGPMLQALSDSPMAKMFFG